MKKKKALSLYGLHSLHGLHFGVTQFVMSCLFTRTFKSRDMIFFCEIFRQNYAKALSELFKAP